MIKRNILFFAFSLCFFAFSSPIIFAGSNQNSFHQTGKKGTRFRENKGQVKDQNKQSRPDVLFCGESNGLAYHLKKDGLHYQLSKVESWKEETEMRKAPGTEKVIRKVADQISVYRVDVHWLGANPLCEIITGEASPDYENYYNVPEGEKPALFVKSYSTVTYKNLYDNIDLKFYQSPNGELEYDFIVHAGGDYKQIQLDIQGAELSINENQELIIKTSLGTITEGALKVHQEGKPVLASWILNGPTNVSYDIKKYNAEKDLTIDPPVRLWSTYYGGEVFDYGLSSTTDYSGNVYLGGYTNSTTDIATTGAHQTTYNGNVDAFLVKFNASGTRLWGTYYGGNDNDYGYSCKTDDANNVYLAGETLSSTAIATAGAHQTTIGGSFDAFLVKFDASGVCQWGTYCGGIDYDNGYSCTTDNTGNVYLTGLTRSTTGIATSGTHQPSINGNYDAFLVKFNASGTCLYGTYYGGINEDFGLSCTTDASGNVYLAGYTASNTDIATIGAHQTAYGGWSYDAFLVKFDASGSRLWGTYYGGNFDDYGESCATDALGNVFLTGYTGSTTDIATNGVHQTVLSGNYDAFLVKFNPSGTRLWGTYYGGIDMEIGFSCATIGTKNVYLSGYTASATDIATSGAHQITYGDNGDAFLVKFDTTGTRLWGSYYGGNNQDYSYSCTTDGSSKVYLAGYSGSTSDIATNGSHQSTNGGDYDAFLVTFKDLNFTANAGPDITICSGAQANMAANMPANTTGFWTKIHGTGTIVNPGSATSLVTSIGTGNVSMFVWTLSDGYASDSDTMVIYRTGDPSNLIINNFGTDYVTFSWSCPNNPDSFQIQYAKNCTANGQKITIPGNLRSYTLYGLNGCSNYCIKLRGKCIKLPTYTNSSWTANKPFTTLGPVTCGSTLNLDITPVQGCVYNLDWSTGCNTADSFRIRYRVNNGNWMITIPGTTGTNKNLTLGQGNWEFRVQTWCGGQNVATSVTYTYSIGSCVIPYSASVSQNTGCNYKIKWETCAPSDSFRVRYRVGTNNFVSSPYTTGNFVNLNLGVGTWEYRVQSWCGGILMGVTPSYFTTIGSCRSAGVSQEVVSNMVLFPNPTTSRSLLNFSSEIIGDYTIAVSDISGRVLNTINGSAVVGENTAEILVDGYAKGVYFVGLTLNGETRQIKLTVQ